MKEVLATSPVVVTKLTTDFNSIQYSFLKIKTLHGFEKILEEILFDVIRYHPKEISLDLRNVIQLDDKLDYLDFYLYFVQILPLCDVKKVYIVLNHQTTLKKITKQIKKQNDKNQKVAVIFSQKTNT